MPQYKLIVPYPGGPPTGTTVTKISNHCYKEDKGTGTSKYRHLYRRSIVEKYPRFWRKIK